MTQDAVAEPLRPHGFRTVYVFGVSQTDRELLPEFPSIHGDPGPLRQRLRETIASHRIRIVEDSISGGALDLSSGGEAHRYALTRLSNQAKRPIVTVHRCF